MENGRSNPQSTSENISYAEMELDFMDELFLDGCWVETADAFSLLSQSPSTFDAQGDAPHDLFRAQTNQPSMHPYQNTFSENPPSISPRKGELVEPRSQDENFVGNAVALGESKGPHVQGTEVSRRLWIAPKVNPGPSSSIKHRLMQAVIYLNECTGDRDMLIQIWVPVKRGGRQVLTTDDQPYSLGPSSKSLEIYRSVSKLYQFPADEDSKDHIGLPGRVFLGKLPEWTPDVRFFRSEEYPRIDYARQYDVSGSLAVPVFEHGSGTCLGVVEIVTTSQKINCRPDLENVCKALEAVDLRSSRSFNCSNFRVNALSGAALPRILEVLKSVSNTYSLPLALTWASCIKLGKEGCRHSDENYSFCVSTVDSACLVSNVQLFGFHEACSEHHLLKGEGIVGKSFITYKPCFSTDITSFDKTEYPLSHHARMFGLECALAVPLISAYTGLIEFVLELFLPKDFSVMEQGKPKLNSLSGDIYRAFRNSQFLTEKKLNEAIALPATETGVASEKRLHMEETKEVSFSEKQYSPEKSSWSDQKSQKRGKEVLVVLERGKEPKEDFKVTTQSKDVILERHQEFWHLVQDAEQDAVVDCNSESVSFGHHPASRGKPGEKKQSKTEKTVTLQVLQQYFAGSLKDAAKKIGVCPTTLKRICRQHGITRWPSRKIRKVNHSLKKLQHVIDSVQGADGTIQLGSFYTSFPELSPNLSRNGPSSSTKQCDPLKQLERGATASKSASSSSGQNSTSTTSCSIGANPHLSIIQASSSGDTLISEESGGLMKRTQSDVELNFPAHIGSKLLARSQSYKSFGEGPGLETLPSSANGRGQNFQDEGTFLIKARFGEEKIRLTLQPTWDFARLQQEIARRFKVDDVGQLDFKYLDDDREWVLLTCDADLEECINVYKASKSHTIRISIHGPSHPGVSSLRRSRSTEHTKCFL